MGYTISLVCRIICKSHKSTVHSLLIVCGYYGSRFFLHTKLAKVVYTNDVNTILDIIIESSVINAFAIEYTAR